MKQVEKKITYEFLDNYRDDHTMRVVRMVSYSDNPGVTSLGIRMARPGKLWIYPTTIDGAPVDPILEKEMKAHWNFIPSEFGTPYVIIDDAEAKLKPCTLNEYINNKTKY